MTKAEKKWAMPNQNNGILTKKQRAQSIKDKKEHKLHGLYQPPVRSSSVFSYGRATLTSCRQRKSERQIIIVTRKDTMEPIIGRTKPTNNSITSLKDDKERPLYRRQKNGSITMIKY